MSDLKDYYILAMDEKDKIKWYENGYMKNEHIELFHIKANSFKEAIFAIENKTAKRFLTAIQVKEIEVEE